MHRNSEDEVSKMVLKSYVTRVNACAMYGSMSNESQYADCLTYMIGYDRDLSEIEQILRSKKLHGMELRESAIQVLKSGFDKEMYNALDSSEW